MAKAWKIKGTRKNQPILYNARHVLSARLDELYSWSEAVRNPANYAALHGMRISAKRLRYSMELYAPFFGATYRSLITTVGQVQKLLGEIHDDSVMAAFVTNYLNGAGKAVTHDHALRNLIAARKANWEKLHRVFLNFWDSLQKDRFRSRLLATLKPRKLD